MANTRSGFIRLSKPISGTKLQQKLLNIINNKEVLREAHRLLGERCNVYVPMKSGALRQSMKAYPNSVRWETPYAHYQYEGDVYGPNLPVLRGENPAWISRRTKYPTGRTLGQTGQAFLHPIWKIENGRYTKVEPYVLEEYTFGYTTPKTSHHWLDKAMENGGLNAYSRAVTAMLKRKAKELNK